MLPRGLPISLRLLALCTALAVVGSCVGLRFLYCQERTQHNEFLTNSLLTATVAAASSLDGEEVVALGESADPKARAKLTRSLSALWQALAQERRPLDQPLFDCLDTEDDAVSTLPEMPLEQQVVEDYQTVGLSLKGHPISFHRQRLNELGIEPTTGLENRRNNQYLRVAGLVILRQRPSTAKGITFVTIEDETGTANLVVKQNIWERYYAIARRSPAWIARLPSFNHHSDSRSMVTALALINI